MLTICKNNRLEIEKEYLALLLNKPDLFSIVQVKDEYLFDDKNRKIFEYAKECFKTYECLNIIKIDEKHKNFDVEYFVELLNDTMWFNSAWKSQLDLAEESIIKFYKEDVIKRLNERLEKGLCQYDDYVKQIKKLDDIVLTDNSITLTKKEILDGINEQHAKINFNNFPKLNDTLEMVKGDFLIIGATTGKGKSSFMLNLMNDLMTGFQCIYFNMEMSKSTIYKRIAAINANVPIDCINKPNYYQQELINNALEKIENAGLIVEHKANDVKQIKSILMKFKDKNRHTILFIDHLGLTKCDNQKSLYEQATEVAKTLRQMCLEYDCTIISASQLNRSAYNSDDLSLSMLKDSGELENSASKVILLQKSNKEDIDKNDIDDMKINIVKNRDGKIGYIDMRYYKTKQIFKEVNYDNRM